MRTQALVAALCLLAPAGARSQPEAEPRISLSAGMGVAYTSYADVTTLINATVAPAAAVPRFKSAVEFFGAFTFPLSHEWLLKFEYASTIASFTPQGAYGPASISLTTQMPSLIVQYMLIDRGVYNVRAGAGGGYHFGSMEEKYFSINTVYTAKGAGVVAEIEANTAFGDHLYAFLGANIRWDLVGPLLDGSGASPGVGSGGSDITLHTFGAGVRLGASYLF